MRLCYPSSLLRLPTARSSSTDLHFSTNGFLLLLPAAAAAASASSNFCRHPTHRGSGSRPCLPSPGRTTKRMSSNSSNFASTATVFPARSYRPSVSSWPYAPSDFARQDESADTVFYAPSRLVTHIDDNAIGRLSEYYGAVLPPRGRILELCSSWVSHFPPALAEAAERVATNPLYAGGSASDTTAAAAAAAAVTAAAVDTGSAHGAGAGRLEVTGYGMNQKELDTNPILYRRVVRDLNARPSLDDVDSAAPASFDAALCVVSIDYLNRPLEVLGSVFKALKPGAYVHLAVSNRCFPTKAVARWLAVGEAARLEMVGDYLWFSGFRDVEILTLVDNSVKEDAGIQSWFAAMKDPLWVVRGRRPAQ